MDQVLHALISWAQTGSIHTACLKKPSPKANSYMQCSIKVVLLYPPHDHHPLRSVNADNTRAHCSKAVIKEQASNKQTEVERTPSWNGAGAAWIEENKEGNNGGAHYFSFAQKACPLWLFQLMCMSSILDLTSSFSNGYRFLVKISRTDTIYREFEMIIWPFLFVAVWFIEFAILHRKGRP